MLLPILVPVPKIHSLKNNTVTTIENCAEEPIQIPGTIQPHGFIIGIDKNEKIVFCSENIEFFLGNTVDNFLSKKWFNVLPKTFDTIIRQHFDANNSNNNSQIPKSILLNGNQFDCFLKNSGEFTILELVTTNEHPYSVYDILEHTNALVKVINEDVDLIALCGLITEKIHAITGYDRIMVYKFDKEYNGEVIAETVAKDVESFLGLHYPHTDIPPQARELYLKNLMRLIVDVDYQPVSIVTNDTTLVKPETVDMTHIHLRSVSPIHIEYLKKMDVKSSFSISLLKEGKLWGLIACHHNSAKNLSFTKQTQAFLQTQILSSQLAVQETADKYKLSKLLAKPYQKLVKKLSESENFKDVYFENMPEVLQIARASGAVLIGFNKIHHNGITPTDKQIIEINTWLQEKDEGEYYTNNLVAEYPKGEEFKNIASGILYFRIITSNVNLSLIFFRPALNKVIQWAGNPNTKEGEHLTPRNSFAAWKQHVEGKSVKWEEAEVDVVFQFVYALQQHLFRQFLKEEEERVKLLNQQLEKANKELENISWISTHDLREPLRKIQVFASMIDSPEDNDHLKVVNKSVKKIQASAERMQKLLDDLFKYSKVDAADANFEIIDLNIVVKGVIQSFNSDFESDEYEIEMEQLPKISGNSFQLQQLFINLIGNSIKFKDPARVQNISVKHKLTAKYNSITYCDTGIGFSEELNEKIFAIFQKGHVNSDYNGTGIGLSICKKIVENHNGKITASGKEGEGVCFKLFFPKTQI